MELFLGMYDSYSTFLSVQPLLKDFFPALPLGFAAGAPAASSADFFPALRGYAGGAPAASSADFFPALRGFDNGGGAADA